MGYNALWKEAGTDRAMGYNALWKEAGTDRAMGYNALWKEAFLPTHWYNGGSS